MNDMTEKTLETLYSEVKDCTKCELCKSRINSVFARGNSNAKLVILGEGPGMEEDQQAKPFVGASGKLLNAALIELGLDIETDIYITNIVRCRPPDNRKPTDDEVECCIDYLHQQLVLVAPKVIIALGNTAIQTLTETTFGITKLHGSFLKYRGIPVCCCFHPSAILRRGGKASAEYQAFKDDLQKAIDKLNELTAKESK